MPDYIKLAIGQSTTIKVKSVEVDRGGKWPDYHFTVENGSIVVAPQNAIDRQLERLTMSPVELVGHYITIERAPNKEDAKKSWWNLSLANKADAEPKPSKRLTAPDTRTPGQQIIDAAIPPDDEPPAFHREVPLPESEDGPSINEQIGLADPAFEGASAKEISYYALAERVAAFQAKLAKLYELPFDAASINAMTFSIWKN